MSYKTNPKVYIDVQIGGSGAGRIIFELFIDLTPKTAENFRGLCTGEYGKVNNIKLHYLNTKFHRINDNFTLQGGDITNFGGTGGYSIYGRTFVDQNFARRHSCAGLLSMANTGRNTNASQFYITLKPCVQMDGKNVVFGQVIDGMEIVRKMSKVPVDAKNKPKIPMVIVDCGQIEDFKDFLKYDPFKKSVYEQIQEKKRKIVEQQHKIRKLLEQGIDPNSVYENKTKLEKCENQLREIEQKQRDIEQNHPEQMQQVNNQQKQPEPTVSNQIKSQFKEAQLDRFLDIKLRLNEAKKLNSSAVLEEQIRENNINYYKQIKKQEWQTKRKHLEEELKAKGIKEEKFYLNRASGAKEQIQIQQAPKANLFTQQALYKAYQKRCKDNSGFDKQTYQKMKNDPTFTYVPTEQALDRLSHDIEKQNQKRSKFSRRRAVDEQQIVTYVNERNRVYNKKLDRSFGKFAENIKTALEMGNQK